jgi:hypothetical protein
MKVFISWSGEQSKQIAEIIRNWLPNVIQAVVPYFSPDDTAKGTRWENEIAKELDASNVGLLVITPNNPDAPWLLFEAGALSKKLNQAKVCPLLFGGIKPPDLKGPLTQFQQATTYSKKEMMGVISMINGELEDRALSQSQLDKAFERWWEEFDKDIRSVLTSTGQQIVQKRSPEDMMEELLTLARQNVNRHTDGINPRAIEAILDAFRRIVEELTPSDYRSAQLVAIRAAVAHVHNNSDASVQGAAVKLLAKIDQFYDYANEIKTVRDVLSNRPLPTD